MDNPRKKKEDARRVSQQPHEQAYQKRKAKANGESKTKGSTQKTGAKRG